MEVLVLGGTRYMGRHLVEALLNQGEAVTLVTRGLTPDSFGNRVTRLVADRTSGQALRRVLAGKRYDVVVDSLAYCSNDVRCLLDHVNCGRYVQTSTLSVYDTLHPNLREGEFDAAGERLVWCDRSDNSYGEAKRQAECAIAGPYAHIPAVRVRFPFVLGADDYTRRLCFYVEHTVRQVPMYIDNLHAQLAFVRSDEAGQFLAFCAGQSFTGAINGASPGTISVGQILDYVAGRTGKAPILSPQGEAAPYNGADSYDMNTEKAQRLGFSFSPLDSWIYWLLDTYGTEMS